MSSELSLDAERVSELRRLFARFGFVSVPILNALGTKRTRGFSPKNVIF